MDDVVLVSFWAAFIVDFVIVVYALRLSKRVGGAGRHLSASAVSRSS